MKRIVVALALGVLITVAGMASAASSGQEGIMQFTVNEFTVYPMLDSSGEMEASLFSGPLSDQEKAAYMPGGKAPSAINVFLLKTASGNIVIDTGWGMSGPGGQALTEKLSLTGLTPDDIDMVVLTHMHPDHIGGLLNGSEPFFSKAKVMVSAPELQYWSRPAEPAVTEDLSEEVEEGAAGDEPAFDPEAAALEEDDAAVDEPVEEAAAPEAEEEAAPAEEAAVPESVTEELPTAPAASADNDDQPAVAANELPRAVIQAYGSRIETFEFGDEVIPGLTAIEAVGHTPGHTALLLKSGERQLLFIGDLIHAAALQFPEPEECASYDMNMEQAVASRKAVLNMASENKIPIAGAHMPFPGVGTVAVDGQRGFAFTPVGGSGS